MRMHTDRRCYTDISLSSIQVNAFRQSRFKLTTFGGNLLALQFKWHCWGVTNINASGCFRSWKLITIKCFAKCHYYLKSRFFFHLCHQLEVVNAKRSYSFPYQLHHFSTSLLIFQAHQFKK